jgi:pimeloyl-ACP methyl ester carboxylesterase
MNRIAVRRTFAAALVTLPLLAGAFAPTETPAVLETFSGRIHGTLLVPAASASVPVVLLIAGSGPTDRNGNSAMIPGANNSLKLLAEGLAAQGIASLRYDKRGIAASRAAGPREIDLRFDMYVDDAAAWLRQLREDKRFSTVTAIGHSEGSLIGILAAAAAGADGYVSVAGIARRPSDVLRDQLRPRLTPELIEKNEAILQLLEQGKTTDAVPPELAPIYRPSVQPYMVSWFRRVPAESIKTLTSPVLIAQGTTDLQVTVAEAEALKKARPDAELLIIDGMNHVLKLVAVDAPNTRSSYGDPSLPVAPALVERLAAFVLALKR